MPLAGVAPAADHAAKRRAGMDLEVAVDLARGEQRRIDARAAAALGGAREHYAAPLVQDAKRLRAREPRDGERRATIDGEVDPLLVRRHAGHILDGADAARRARPQAHVAVRA